MKIATCCALIFAIIISCKQENDTPKVKYDAVKKEVKSNNNATENAIEVSDLPIQIEGIRYIMHPIGTIRDKKYGENSYVLSNYNRYELTGNFRNIKFQHQDSTTFKALTDKAVSIQNVTYLETVAKKLKKQLLVYILEDQDSNKDAILDDNDIKDLYISEVSGENFTKLSPDFQEVIDWKLIESKNRIYFRSVEDSNKNGAFDKSDKVHYYFVDLTQPVLKAEEYNVVD